MELPKGIITTEEYWTQHIRAAESFKGTKKEYCRRAGIKYGSLSAYRKKLGYTKRVLPEKSNFTKVEVTKPQTKKSAELPEAEWLARFLKAWTRA